MEGKIQNPIRPMHWEGFWLCFSWLFFIFQSWSKSKFNQGAPWLFLSLPKTLFSESGITACNSAGVRNATPPQHPLQSPAVTCAGPQLQTQLMGLQVLSPASPQPWDTAPSQHQDAHQELGAAQGCSVRGSAGVPNAPGPVCWAGPGMPGQTLQRQH